MRVALQVALAAGVSSGLYTAAVLVPTAAAPVVLLVPLPGLVVAGVAPAACSLWLFVTASVLTVVVGADAALGFALPFGLPAVLLATGMRRAWSFERTVVAGVTGWCLGMVCISLLAYGSVAAVVAAIREQLTKSVDLALSMYASVGAPENAVALLDGEREVVVTGLLEVLPALMVLTAALAVMANLLLLRRWAGTAPTMNLRLWRTPDALIWVLIAAGFGMFLPVPLLVLLAKNLFAVVLGCYFCQGLAIVSYYLDRLQLPRGVRIAGYVIIAVQHVVTAMVLALGVFDLWGNFRRLGAGSADVPFHTDGE